ncbi:hypothetical protein [Aliterella atlantica]|uniref:hypothetical protein n=1 Tax=Aliterella atlantica TaxID=1827278 RepID=UPI00069914C0|nr:hypothetical protein [Aliterella atlantica]
MSIVGLRKVYLAIGIATASAIANGVATQVQATELSADKAVKIESNFDEQALASDYNFMLQLSEPQTAKVNSNQPTVLAQANDSTIQNQTPSTDGTTPSTSPSDSLQPTTPSTSPSDSLQPTTPNTLPGDTTQPTTPNTLPGDTTQPTTPNTLPGDTTQPTTPNNTLPSDSTQPTIPSDGSDPSIRDNTQPTIPSDGNTPTNGSDPDSDVSPGRATRSGSSYIGVGGNIGLGGETGIGEGSFSVISKIGLTNNISVRPTALFGDNVSILLPVTLDFAPTDVEVGPYSIAPYVGAGALISTGDNSDVGVLITGGIDVPITSQFTATAGVNVGFVGDTDVGILIGVGYNFSGL